MAIGPLLLLLTALCLKVLYLWIYADGTMQNTSLLPNVQWSSGISACNNCSLGDYCLNDTYGPSLSVMLQIPPSIICNS